MSDAVGEDEWLLGPGAEYEIGEIKPELMTDRSKERVIDTVNEVDKKKYLEDLNMRASLN